MNIAFFSESYKPYLSGVTNSIETLTQELEKLGHKVFIFAPDYPDAAKSENVYRYPSTKAPYPKYRLAIPRPFETIKILREQKIDIIHSHSPYQLGLLSMWCARKLKLPFVFTMHTIFNKYLHYIPFMPENISDKIMSDYLKGFANRCDTAIVATEKAKEYLESTGTSTKIEVVPNGINLELFENLDPDTIRQKYNISKLDKVLIFVGRLAKEKNIPFLLRVFRSVINRVKNAVFLIVAGGPLESELKQEAVNLGINEKTIFTGEIPFPEVLNCYAAADLFIFSSLTETQGLVLPEAMAAGLPVIAVNSEGVANMVKDNESGYLVALNEELFSEKVVELLNNETGLSMLRQSTKVCAKQFSSEIFADKIEKIYSSLIK